MSWLRNHMRHFVIPGIHALGRANGRRICEADIKPSDREVRPASVCEYPEAGMLYAVCSSILRKSDPTREVALGLCRHIGKPGDAEFVYQLDSQNRVKELAEGYDGVEGADVLHSFVLNSVKSLKRRTRKKATIVYPGRDVWCWEVLSRKLGQPSVFDSRVSRDVAGNEKALKKAIADWSVPDWNRTVLFDSGYEGTVPRAIGKAAGLQNVNVLMLSAVRSHEQIFPTHSKARRKALACEYLAKYQRRSVVIGDEAFQELADLEEFIKAALLTIWLWYHVSPSRLPSWKDRPATKGLTVSNVPTISFGSSQWRSGSIALSQSLAGSPVKFYPVYNNTTITGSSATSSGFIDNLVTLDTMWGSGTSAMIVNDLVATAMSPPLLDPNTAQLVQPTAVTQPIPSSPGGPAGGSAPGPATLRMGSMPSASNIRIVTDGNGKPTTA